MKKKNTADAAPDAPQSTPEKKTLAALLPAGISMKDLIYWLMVLAVAAFLALYFALDWTSQVFNIGRVFDAAIKSVCVIILSGAASKIISLLFSRMGEGSNRSKTVNRLLASLVRYAIAIAAIVLALTFFIEDTSSLFTGLSMLTLVVGLGAQTLISDIVAGIFIVFEGSYQVGDVVVIDGWRGTVNEIGIRTTKIEDAGGNIEIINNSSISKIINNSTHLSVAVCDVGIEYGESIERVENIIKDNLDYIRSRIPDIVEGPFYKGVASLGDSAVVVKIVAKSSEDSKFQVQRDLNREIKILFDKHNVGIPFPQMTLSYLETEEVATASAREKRSAQKFVDEQKELSRDVEEYNH